jgi:hypothetical protein
MQRLECRKVQGRTKIHYYCILSSIYFLIYKDAEILTAHYTWKVAFANLINTQSI